MIDTLDTTFVCNLKPIIFVNVLFGFPQNVQGSQPIRFLLKLYTIVFSASLLLLGCTEIDSVLPIFLKAINMCEYALYVLFAWRYKDEYFYKYYKYSHLIDGYPGAEKIYKNFETLAKMFFVTLVSMRLINVIVILLYYAFLEPEHFYSRLVVTSLIILAMQTGCDIGRFTILATLALVYIRSKVMKDALEAADFKNTFCDSFFANRYTKMYLRLIEAYEFLGHDFKDKVCANSLIIQQNFKTVLHIILF